MPDRHFSPPVVCRRGKRLQNWRRTGRKNREKGRRWYRGVFIVILLWVEDNYRGKDPGRYQRGAEESEWAGDQSGEEQNREQH
jgi:hypothetical protein